VAVKDYSDAKRKELETRRQLGPRLGHPVTRHRHTAEPPLVRIPRVRVSHDHPTRDSR